MGEQIPQKSFEDYPEKNEISAYFDAIEDAEFQINAARLLMNDFEHMEYCAEVIDALREECPFIAETVYIRGQAKLPIDFADEEDSDNLGGSVVMVNRRDDEDNEVAHAFVDGVYGMYRGVGISKVLNEDNRTTRYEISHTIHLGDDEEITGKNTKISYIEYIGHFNRQSQIILEDEMWEAIVGDEQTERFNHHQLKQLLELSRQLIDMIGSRKFLQLDKSQQFEAYEALMSEVHQHNGIVGELINVQLRDNTKGRMKRPVHPAMYVPVYDYKGELIYEQVDMRQEGITEITGTCFGIVSLEDINISESGLTKNKIIDAGAGLCLAIDPGFFEEFNDAEDYDDDLAREPKMLLLPLGKGNHIKSLNVVSRSHIY